MNRMLIPIRLVQTASFIYDIFKFNFLLSNDQKLINIGLAMLTIRLVGHFFILSIFDKFDKNDKCLIVLGHYLKNNKMRKTLINRLDLAIECYKSNPDILIVCSGGVAYGNTIAEAKLMKQYLIENGVKENSILCEDSSNTTIENFKNNIKKYPNLKNEPITIVSSVYHLRRSKLIAKLAGFNNVKTIGSKTSIFKLLTQLEAEKIFYLFALIKR